MDITIHIMMVMNDMPQFLCLHKDNCGLPSHISNVARDFHCLKSLLSTTNDTHRDHCYDSLIRVFWAGVPFGM